MYRQNCLSACLMMILGLTSALESNSFCTQNPNTGPNMPSSGKRSFRAEIAAKIIEKKMSVYAVQVMSFEAQRYSMTWTMAKQTQFFIHDLTTNETIIGDSNGCSLTDKNDPLNMLTANTMSAFSGEAEYINKTTIRGIPVDHWRKCLSWPTFSNFTLDFYIYQNAIGWSMPSVLPVIPVRIELQGRMFQDSSVVPIHHVYDYIHFEEFDGDKYSADLEPPEGVLCPGVKPEVPIPVLPDSIIFSRETSHPLQRSIDDETVFYDTNDQLSRTDYFDGQSNLRIIKDFTGGVSYKLDVTKDICDILPLDQAPTLMNNDINLLYTRDANGLVHMQTVQDYFMTKGNFTFEGEHQVRGVTCNLFAQRVNNYKDYQGPTMVELYFAKAGPRLGNTHDWDTVVETQLMRVTISSAQDMMSSDIYNFAPNFSPTSDHFDVSSCFNDSSQIRFIISFVNEDTTDPNPMGSQDSRAFASLVRAEIARQANVSKLRVHWDDITSNSARTNFVGKLLDKPPAIDSYIKTPGRSLNLIDPSHWTDAVVTVKGIDASTCARYCSKDTSQGQLPDSVDRMASCVKFDFCSGYCYLHPKLPPGSYGVMNNDVECANFQKATDAPSPISLVEAWARLRDAIYGGQLLIPVENYGPSHITTVFTAISLTNLNPDSDSLAKTDAPLFDYTELPGRKMSKPVMEKVNVSLDSCARLCSNNLNFQCLTFSYCESTHDCTLYDYRVQENVNLPPATLTDCNTYTRSYLKDFEEIPDTLILSNSGTMYPGTSDAEECAHLCLNHTDFTCQSFEYCVSGKCYLGQIHVYDRERDDTNENRDCTHFSRNYATLYDEVPNKVTRYAVDRNITGVSVAQCARICSQDTSYGCTTFQFCENQGLCQLIRPSAMSATNVSLVDMFGCGTYTIKKSSAVSTPQKASDDTGFSAGAMAGIGVGMLVLGAVLCVVAIVLFARIRNKDDSTTSELQMGDPKDEML